MITDTLYFSGLTTKTKAMESRFFSAKDYGILSNFTSITEFVAFLKNNTSYEKLFESVDEHNLHRSEIERIITNSLYTDFTKLYKFSSIKQRSFLDLMLMKYEVYILKRCLRIVFDQRNIPTDFISASSFFLKYSKLDINVLANSANIGEFINNLKGSIYYDVFNKLQVTSHETLFDYEMQLDIYFFTYVWKQKKKLLAKAELDIVTKLIGNEIDLLNIMWIYRSKKYYNIKASDIYTYIIPIFYKLNKNQINTLVECPTIDDFANNLKNTYYAKLYGDIGYERIEDAYNIILNKIYEDAKRKHPYSIAYVINYLHNKELELDKLTTVLECIRYGLSSQEIMAYTTQADISV